MEQKEKAVIEELGEAMETGALSLDEKLRLAFDGKIVRKDLTKQIKEGVNVPVYVLEYLLDQYCNSEDEQNIERGVLSVKQILADI